MNPLTFSTKRSSILSMRIHKVPGKGVYARVGDFHGPMAESPQKAIDSLNRVLESYHPLDHTYVRANDGTVFHVHETPSNGWNVFIIGPLGFEGKGFKGGDTRGLALERAKEEAILSHGGVIA